ncbi:MAG TPA: serine hydrolase domain-containing protein [Thermoanaerobaculia bacterium]|jgi:CubicO group peptidase (beta-lactamase class C family)|nr:serine hydrolase domain-containing protein [Thermoanaerobaculia bacterium]
MTSHSWLSRALAVAFLTIILLGAPAARAAAADTEPPKTPAGKVFAAWLAAFNSADAAQLRAFDAAYPREATPPPVEDRLRFREVTGGFTVVRIEKSEPLALTVLLQEKGSDTVARLEMKLGAGEPPKILSSTIEAIPRPPDLAIPRLKEAEALAALTARAEEQAKKDQFSGVVLVARHGQVLSQKAWGLANRETKKPNTLDTRFRLGSMNKMFTSVATLQLIEAGKLSLDDTIGKILPDYPNKDVASKVTVRHLLTHTGGTGDIFGPDFEKNRLTLREHSDYVKLYGSRGLDHEPGAEFRYSNYGFVLLGALIEKVTGTSYYDYVRSHIFQPAGMTSTDSLTEAEAVPNRSVGYMKGPGGWAPNTETLPWRGTSAGGGYSTAGDLLRFAQALESGKLISKASLAAATTPNKEDYGYGFGIEGEGPLRSYGHSGGAPGMNGDLRIYPQLGYVVISLSNLDPPAASRLVEFFTLRMPAS